MLKDAQGLAVTTDSPVTLAAINDFLEQALSYGKKAETVILQGIAADPDCGIVQAYAAAYYLSLESATAKKQGIFHLNFAQKSLAKATERERLYGNAIAAWANGNLDQAIALHETLALKFPQDLVSVQQGQYHYFYRGEMGKLLNIAQQVLPANRENHYLYGMLAFGLEQCQQLSQAEEIGRRAVKINRFDPWAQHAVAHVLDTQGRIKEGIAWLESFIDTWENCNSLLYTHNSWHLALYYLAQGDAQKVLNLYDTHIWGGADPNSPKDQVGAISLLLKLELQGISVGNRWDLLIPHLFLRLHEHSLPFQDLHYIYALARGDQIPWVTEMLSSMQNHATTLNPHSRKAWREVAIPTAQALIAHAQGDWSTAFNQLQPILPHLHRIGGSYTQRKLFTAIYHDALSHHQQGLRKHPIAHRDRPLKTFDQAFIIG